MGQRSSPCRLPCELRSADRIARGIAVEVSETGLFVQTRTPFEAGDSVEVRVLSSAERPELSVAARVERVRRVHPAAETVVARGMGLELVEPGAAWRALVAAVLGQAPPATGGDFGLPRFRVVIRCKDEIRVRTRVVSVACLDEAEARSGVDADLEEGWEIVKIEREAPAPDADGAAQAFRVVALREGGSLRWEALLETHSGAAARAAAEADLGAGWRIEAVEPAEAAPATPAAPEPPGGASRRATAPSAESLLASEPLWYQVMARLAEGDRIRTRVAKLRARSAEEAATLALAQLGAGWQLVKVREP